MNKHVVTINIEEMDAPLSKIESTYYIDTEEEAELLALNEHRDLIKKYNYNISVEVNS